MEESTFRKAKAVKPPSFSSDSSLSSETDSDSEQLVETEERPPTSLIKKKPYTCPKCGTREIYYLKGKLHCSKCE